MSPNAGRNSFKLPSEVNREYLTVKDFAHECSLSSAEIYYLIRKGKLTPDQRFGILILSRKSLDQFRSTKRR
jgi:hypothetical protein